MPEPPSEDGLGPIQELDADLGARLHLSDDSPTAGEHAAGTCTSAGAAGTGSPLQSAASQVFSSSPSCASQQPPRRQQPSVCLPVEEPGDSENVQAGEGTPSSRALPSPHPQRGPLSPLTDAGNLQHPPTAPQVGPRCNHKHEIIHSRVDDE